MDELIGAVVRSQRGEPRVGARQVPTEKRHFFRVAPLMRGEEPIDLPIGQNRVAAPEARSLPQIGEAREIGVEGR